MMKYAKITNNITKEVSVGLGTDVEFYKSLGMTEMEVEQSWNGSWYVKGHTPSKPIPSVQEQIDALEAQITDRNVRSALLGDDYAISKITSIEAQIAELRKQL